jgi:hypothetical protein
MILTTITILGTLMLELRFDTGIAKIKAGNLQRKAQAKINAESGVHIAMARLAIYKEAFNSVQKNKNLKNIFKAEMLNQIWNIPLAFPIPSSDKMNILEKTAIKEFEDNSLLEGELTVSIQSISNRVNINLLRVSSFLDFHKLTAKSNTPNPNGGNGNGGNQQNPGANTGGGNPNEEEENDEDPIKNFEKQFIELLATAIERKIQADDQNELIYGDINVEELVAAVKYYVSDPNTDIGPLTNQIASEFQKNNIQPKNAPLTSISELGLIPGWTQEMIDLVANDITVHGDPVIDINEITGQFLKTLFPELTQEDIKEFFDAKNNPDTKQFFNTIDDLKQYFVETTRRLEKSYVDERVEVFEKAGLKFGSAPLLFKITSTGKYQESTMTLSVIAAIQSETKNPPPANNNNSNPSGGGTGNNQQNPGGPSPAQPPNGNGQNGNQNQEKTTELKEPKILVYLVN